MKMRKHDLREDIKEKTKKYGWRVDAIISEKCETGTGVDIHTHGLMENFNHKDLECILPVECYEEDLKCIMGDNDITRAFVHSIYVVMEKVVERIKKGEKFKAGKCYNNINGELRIRMLSSVGTDGRDLLRIILPDLEDKLHKSLMMNEDYKKQFNGI